MKTKYAGGVLCLGLMAAVSLGLLFGLVIGSVSLGALYIHRRRYNTHRQLSYIKYSLDFLRPIKTAEAFEVVDRARQ